ncbi:MAG: M3 family oligoendopeptidase, partial [Proteobacteria bacterium]|nr:M3 family oligoendopeptidase [Pseudomonadota bacterium]
MGGLPLALDLDSLPEWDLSDLYPGMDSGELARDLDAAQGLAEAFESRHGGKLADLDGARLGAAIAEYEAIDEILGRVMSYAALCHAAAVDDPETARFHQDMHERVNAISARLLFFTLELNELEDAPLAAKMADPAAAHYAPWVRDRRAHRPYQLSAEIERLLHEKSVAGRAAWMRLFDETMDGLRFPLDGKDLTSAEALHLLSDHDGDVRMRAAKVIGAVLAEHTRVFALIFNTLIKDKEIEDEWRGFKRPISARNLSNLVEDAVVDALTGAVRDAYPRLSHRYYALKAGWFGLDALPYWDRNAPLPDEDERVISWDSAKDCVLGAYGNFSPEMAELGRRFFDNPWIDAATRPGKAPGAFSHPTVPKAHPYILLNYQGTPRDVMTLAHELGHGVHQLLAAGRRALTADTPLTLAETASVFGEQLTFRALLDGESDPARRRVMLAAKVEDMLNTVVRQVAFCDFERRLHDERRAGELTPARIGEIWLEVQAESLGPAIAFDDGYAAYWSYIPHFIHSPFYVYAYAFGDCLVNSLYGVYRDQPDGFEAKYLDMLRAGGTLRHKELLAPFGLDASDPGFWNRGLDVISGFIDDLEH